MTDNEEKKSQENNNRNEKVMPFLDHLEELRQRLLRCIFSIILFSFGSYFFAKQIMKILLRPYPKEEKLIFLAPTEGFITYIKISIFVGIIMSLPVIFYQLWKFVVPGLYKKERKYVPLIVLLSTLFFLTGALFCYFVIIPYGLNFLLGFSTDQLEPNIQIKEYLKFVTIIVLLSNEIGTSDTRFHEIEATIWYRPNLHACSNFNASRCSDTAIFSRTANHFV